MPARTTTKRNKSRSTSQPRLRKKLRRRTPASHLLIIQCEPDKLAQQGLDFGSKVSALCSLPFRKKRIVSAKAYSKDKRCRTLGETLQSHDRFRTVLIVGHSNEYGLQLTPDQFYDWKAVGEWLKPFQPEFLLLMACQAGRSSSARILFQQVPSLREVYASPVAFFTDQTHPLAGLLVALVKNERLTSVGCVSFKRLVICSQTRFFIVGNVARHCDPETWRVSHGIFWATCLIEDPSQMLSSHTHEER